jgi:hypothetical protein
MESKDHGVDTPNPKSATLVSSYYYFWQRISSSMLIMRLRHGSIDSGINARSPELWQEIYNRRYTCFRWSGKENRWGFQSPTQ